MITLLFIVILNSQLKGQAIKIQSFDGKTQTINVSHDSGHDVLTISTAKDTIRINHCSGLEETSSFNKHFVKISYQVRGGSGIRLRRMIILTSKNDRLYSSLHVTSLFSEQFIDYSKKAPSSVSDKTSLYEVKIRSFDRDHQKLILSIHDTLQSKDQPKSNHNSKSDIALNFDATRNVFYSNEAKMAQDFVFHDSKTGQKNKKYLKGEVPVVELGKYVYYYTKGDWYEKNGRNSLFRYAYK